MWTGITGTIGHLSDIFEHMFEGKLARRPGLVVHLFETATGPGSRCQVKGSLSMMANERCQAPGGSPDRGWRTGVLVALLAGTLVIVMATPATASPVAAPVAAAPVVTDLNQDLEQVIEEYD